MKGLRLNCGVRQSNVLADAKISLEKRRLRGEKYGLGMEISYGIGSACHIHYLDFLGSGCVADGIKMRVDIKDLLTEIRDALKKNRMLLDRGGCYGILAQCTGRTGH